MDESTVWRCSPRNVTRCWLGVGAAVVIVIVLAPLAVRAANAVTAADVEELLARRAYDEARQAALEHLAAVEAENPQDSLPVADALDLLGRVLNRDEKTPPPELVARLERVIELREVLQGPTSQGLADSLKVVATLEVQASRLDRAEELFDRALAITRSLHGNEHADTASLQTSLASVAYRRGDYDRARELLEAALPVQERLLGPTSAGVASTLNGLASTYNQLGDYARARKLWERALEIRRTTLGPDDPAIAQSLNNVALSRYHEADFVGALATYREALELRRRTLPPDDPRIAYSLNGCALTLRITGDLTAARELLEEALALFERSLGPEHQETVLCMGHLADLVTHTGDTGRALELSERMVAAATTAFGPSHHWTGTARLYRAAALLAADRPAEARPWAEQGTAIIRAVFGEDNEELAAALLDLSDIDRAEGKLEQARLHIEEALQIRERLFGPDHPKVATCLRALAEIDLARGDLMASQAEAERALAISNAVMGSDSREAGLSLLTLARVHRAAGRPEEALAAAVRAEDIGRRYFMLVLQGLSEREALRFAELRRSGLDLLLELASAPRAPAVAVRAAWQAVLRSRASVLDEMALRRRISGRGGSDLAPFVKALAAARENYVRLLIRGLGSDSPERFATLLAATRSRLDDAERALAQHSSSYRAGRRFALTSFDDLSSTVALDTALVAYVVRTPAASDGHTLPERSYLALVLPAGRGRRPLAVALGSAATIEELVAQWRRLVTSGDGAAATESLARVAGERLRQAVWDPVAAMTGDAATVLVVPDGALQLVNLAALPIATDGYLVERDPTLHLLTSERDLEAAPRAAPPGRGLLAIGAPDFDAVAVAAADSVSPGSFRGGVATCDSFRSFRFEPLPGTSAELEDVTRTWQAQVGGTATAKGAILLTGAAATETAFKRQAPSREVLHLATHGFFLGADCGLRGPGNRGIGGLTPASPANPRTTDDNPLHLSGLALAGANHRLEAPPDEDDGVLTAEEVAALDLEGVDWAVLSACDTGVGVVEAGQGVLGLRRAFRIAGVRTVVMSLWSVADEPTQEWMGSFYRARLEHHLDVARAVRQATRELLQARRERGESTLPFFWGAFIAAGDWRPPDGSAGGAESEP